MSKIFNFNDIEKIKSNKIVFFDFGANVGAITEIVSKLKNNIKIFSFEPVLKNFNILKNKFKKNNSIKLENKAVWFENKKNNFSVGRKNNHTNSKFTKIINDLNYNKQKYIDMYEVECIDISQYMKNLNLKNKYVIVKMDIEGAEYEVLSHMIKTDIISVIDILLIEFHREPNEGIIKKITNDIFEIKNKIKIYKEVEPGKFKEIKRFSIR